MEIAAELRRRIEEDLEFGAGQLLPSESELAGAYGVSRVTVRKALESLRDEGLIDSRQGYGWFVVGEPVRQTLGRLQTIEAQLEARGVASERRVLDFGLVRAPAWVRAVLGSGSESESVLRVRRLQVVDGRPFARVTVWVPKELGAGLSRQDVEQSPFYDLLPVRLGGARQTIGAAAALAADAAVLQVPTGAPVLRCERVTRTSDGVAVLVSEWVFPAHATEFVVELPEAPPVWRT